MMRALRLQSLVLVGIFTGITLCVGAHANPVQSFKIVFASNRFSPPPPEPAKWQIYVMDSNGSHVRRLTSLPDSSIMPSFSPDGRLIAFTVAKPGEGDRSIYLMDADGSHVHRLITGMDPAFSPDSRRVVFSGWTFGSTIRTISVDGTHLVDTGQSGLSPSFIPDGRKILFTCRINPPHDDQVCIMDPDGSHPVSLTNGFEPRFSPDGRAIVFASRGREVRGVIWPWALICVMNADGSDVHCIGDPSSSGTDPSFMPDGRLIYAKRHVYPNNALTDMQVCVMNVDGTGDQYITKGPWENGWRPFF